MRRLTLLAFLLAAAACPSRKLPGGLPPADACAVDDDCVVMPPPDRTGCCFMSDSAPMAKRYHDAVAAWAKGHCADSTCPPSPFPGARPAECFFVPRCRQGKCSTACDP
jgi:hypothetical protein